MAETTKILAVTGATGTQGGGVVNIMKSVQGWKVRAITRNKTGEKAKALEAAGCEVVQADFDDEESLVKAFEGAHAIFAVTNWWEPMFTQGKNQAECSAAEEEHGMKLARAADRTPTLENYIWSSEPPASRDGLAVPHFDSKAKVDERIKAELPGLAAKKTALWVGYYPQNMVLFPVLVPTLDAESGKYVWTVPSKPDAKILLSGDMNVTMGTWVRQILASGDVAKGKICNVALERWTFREMLDEWNRLTGREGVYKEATAEEYAASWGVAGAELALQMKWGEVADPWRETPDHVSIGELGIREEEVVGFTGAIESLKAFW